MARSFARNSAVYPTSFHRENFVMHISRELDEGITAYRKGLWEPCARVDVAYADLLIQRPRPPR